MATEIKLTSQAGTNAPYKLGSPPDFGTLYSGRALEFDGVTDYLLGPTITTGADFMSVAKDFTVAFWINADTLQESVLWSIKQSNSDRVGSMMDETGQIGMSHYDNRTGSSVGYERQNSATGVIHTGTWYRIVCAWTGEGTATTSDGGSSYANMTFYVNGVSQTGNNSSIISSGLGPSQTELTIGYIETNLDYLGGKMSDWQAWDKKWTQSDVQYDYTHPEKLITDNSAVTSGTTISNLKLWYPMTEGNPRSPQTTVYDGSPKGLGSELLTNGGFSDEETGWTTNDGGSSDVTSGIMKLTDDGSWMSISQVILTSGIVYKVVFDYRTDGTARASIGSSSGGNQYSGALSATTIFTTKTIYFTATGTTVYFNKYSSGGVYVEFDNVSIKEVKMGNHGTTKFYGTELVTNGDSDSTLPTINSQNLASYDVASFAISTAITGSTATYNGAVAGDDSILVTADSSSAYPLIRFLDGTDCGLVTGRTYYISCYVYLPASQTLDTLTLQALDNGSSTIALGGTGTTTTTNTWVKLYGSYVSDDPIRCFELRGSGGDVSGEIFYIDQISIKEVGVAAGWTTADAEPLIPQTALMGMSKPILFNGIDDYVDVGGLAVLGNDHTLSAWFKTTGGAGGMGSEATLISYITSGGGGDDSILAVAAGKLAWSDFVDDDQFGTSTVNDGNWHHGVVVVTTANQKIYVDGALETTTTNSYSAGTAFSACAIGRRADAAQRFFGGEINEVAIWDSVLSLAQIQELYNDGVALDATVHSKSGNLVGYWRNDGASKWLDRSISENLVLDGDDDYVNCPNIDLSGGEGTITAWFNHSEADTQTIFAYGSNGDDISVQSRGSVHDLAMTDGINNVGNYETGGSVSLNTWNHVALTVASSGVKYVYLNGSAVISDTGPDNSFNFSDIANNTLMIGKQGSGGGTFFNGIVDQVAVWDTVLSSDEISSIYNAGRTGGADVRTILSDKTGNLKAYYQFETENLDDDGKVIDLSGNGNLGTLTGGATISGDNDGTVSDTSPDTILLPEGTTSGNDILGFPLTHPNNGWLNLSGEDYTGVVIPHSSVFNRGDLFTLSFWIKVDKNSQTTILSRHDSNDNNSQQWWLEYITDSGGRVRFRNNLTNIALTTATINDGLWNYIVYIANGATSKFYWYDSAGTRTISGNLTNPTIGNLTAVIPTVIGSTYSSTTETPSRLNFGGSIDEVMYYARVLEQEEITKNYKYGKSKHKN